MLSSLSLLIANQIPAHVVDEEDLERVVLAVLREGNGNFDPIRCAELVAAGRRSGERLVASALTLRNDARAEVAERVASRVLARVVDHGIMLSGAEAAAALLTAHGVTHVFAYAGTSELALCDAVDRLAGIKLVNGRGDKESAFLAAGASLLNANRGAAILHGARGLTNAAGAVADARRNEAGTMFLVGLPSTGSVRFLPPHAEADLLGTLSQFTDWWWEASAVPANGEERATRAAQFVGKLHEGLAAAARPPYRPSMVGIPQDVAEHRWIPARALAEAEPPGPATSPRDGALEAALEALRRARRPLFLVDDYALRFAGIRGSIDRISALTGAPVMQLRYRRGPMLFERIQASEVRNFVGWLNQFSAEHERLLNECDLFITVEDRNIYRRVVGDFPGCRKVAIDSDPAKVLKNEYLGEEDVLVAGNPVQVIEELANRVEEREAPVRPWFAASARDAAAVTPEPPGELVVHARRAVTRELARVLARWSRPVLVDDSQMFGGLLSEHYDEFPPGLRVFGGHGGFVGGGLAYATGLAIANPDVRVMCTLGDQGFTNAFQGLVAALQERARVLFVVCNNGESVSLNKQAEASYGGAKRSYLRNVSGFRYSTVAEALGVRAQQLIVPIGSPRTEMDAATSALARVLDEAVEIAGPSLIELVLPADPQAWRGIWLTQGFEQKAPARA